MVMIFRLSEIIRVIYTSENKAHPNKPRLKWVANISINGRFLGFRNFGGHVSAGEDAFLKNFEKKELFFMQYHSFSACVDADHDIKERITDIQQTVQ